MTELLLIIVCVILWIGFRSVIFSVETATTRIRNDLTGQEAILSEIKLNTRNLSELESIGHTLSQLSIPSTDLTRIVRALDRIESCLDNIKRDTDRLKDIESHLYWIKSNTEELSAIELHLSSIKSDTDELSDIDLQLHLIKIDTKSISSG